MDIKYYQDAKEFLDHTREYLAKEEARCELILGLAQGLVRFPHRYGQEEPWFCSIGTGTEINAVAMRTPPLMVLMTRFSGDIGDITAELVRAVAADFNSIPGVVGDKDLGDAFAQLWCREHSTKIASTMEQRIHRLDKVNDVPLSPGRFRAATMEDKELVDKWFHAFYVDIGSEARDEPELDRTPLIELGWLFLWEDGEPVSMALKTRPTEKGMSVGGVYTPTELRGKGYATSCVAELSRNILQSGKKFCMLYTDLANPTSNSIYRKIGYKPVGDSVQHTFDVPERRTK